MSDDRHAHAQSVLGTTRAGRARLGTRDSERASRTWWDADAADYHRTHGEFLGVDSADGEFVWCPEGLHEDDVHLLGDVSGRDVLEVGCGSAPCARWLAGRGARAVGLDISMGMLARGQAAMDRGGPRVPLVQAGAEDLPFADESFDIVCSAFGAVPFVADSARVMREVARVLRPGGVWVFAVNHPIRWIFPDDPGERGADRDAAVLRSHPVRGGRRDRGSHLRRASPHHRGPGARTRRGRPRDPRHRRTRMAGGARPRVGPVEPAAGGNCFPAPPSSAAASRADPTANTGAPPIVHCAEPACVMVVG